MNVIMRYLYATVGCPNMGDIVCPYVFQSDCPSAQMAS